MMVFSVRVRLSCILGILVCSLIISACTVGGSSSPQDTDVSADTDTNATAVSASLPQAAVADEAPPAPPSSNESRSVEQHLSDASVEARIKRALVRERSLRLFDFDLEVVNGHTWIQGDVNTHDQYRRAERVARNVDGVEAVTNELTVGGQPVSEGDSSSATQAEASSSSDREASAVYYTVRRGDTLWGIAREHETSVRQIRSLNDLQSSSLSPGTRIRVR